MAGDKYASLRAEFVDGAMTVADLARAHGVPEKPLQLAATRQEWQRLRAERIKNDAQMIKNEEERAMREAAASRAEKRARQREECDDRYTSLAQMVAQEAVRAVRAARDAQEPQRAQDIRALAGAVESAQRVERLALGMNTESQEVRATVSCTDDLDDETLRRELEARGLPATLFENAPA